MEISVQKWAEKWNRHHTKMRYLTEFERKVQLYDSLIIETGGRCAQGKCDGDKYEQKCLDDARNYILAGGSKKHLIEMTLKTRIYTWTKLTKSSMQINSVTLAFMKKR